MIGNQSPPPADKRLDFIDRDLKQKRSVNLKTCADVYGHWRTYKRTYKKAPGDGVEFQIDYIDTGLALDEVARASAPIALALHGAPGSYHDFALLIQHLSQQKVRVIAPNFPEYIATVKTKVLFRHSADEKAAYLRDFLRAIQVNKIDLLVSHSSAIFPTLLILLNANDKAIARQRHDQQQQKLSTTTTTKKPAVVGHAARHACRESEQDQHEQNDDTNQVVNDEDEAAALPDASVDHDELFEDAREELPLDGNNNNQKSTVDKHANNDKLSAAGAGDAGQTKKQPQPNQVGAQLQQLDQQQQQQQLNKKLKNKRKTDVIVKFEQPIEIKAVALFNPAGHRLPKSMKPTWFKCGSVHVYQTKFGRSLFRKFGPAFLTAVGVPVRVDNMDNVMLSATVMRNSKCQRVSRQLQNLSEMQIPTLLVFSENDKLIEKEIFYEMTQFMRLDQKKFDVFNDDGDIELSQSRMEDWIRVMVFKAGGHYAYSNYAKTVNQAVSELLERVRTKTSSNIK